MIRGLDLRGGSALSLAATLLACQATPERPLSECPIPEVPLAVAALDSAFRGPDTPLALDSALWQATRHQADFPPVVSALRAGVERYGEAAVARSLLMIVHQGSPYFIDAADRGQAAIAYGSLHRLYPEAAPVTLLPALLLKEYYPDETREGVAIASRYFRGESPELSQALAAVLCQAADHLRPFVRSPSDLAFPQRLHWYSTALRLLRESVKALAVRPDGESALQNWLASETNDILADQVRRWAAQADTFPYWWQERETP